MASESFYFSHDVDARNDIKIKALRKQYGIAGYGAFWVIVELLRDADKDNYQMPLKEFTYIGLEEEIGSGIDIKTFIDDCIHKFELLESDGDFFWSSSLCRRMDKKEEVRNKRKEAAEKRWSKEKSNANVSSINSDVCKSNAKAMQNDAKKRKDKEKKIEEKDTTTTNIENTDYIDTGDKVDQKSSSYFSQEEFQEIVKLYSENIELPKPLTADWLVDMLQDYGFTWLKNAIIEANQAGKRTQKYIKGILANWKTGGGMTLKKNRVSPKSESNKTYSDSEIDEFERRMWEKQNSG